jgi:hypothetical protein
MRIQIEPYADRRTTPRSLFWGEVRIEVIEIMDQWYGPGYLYVKVRGHDGSVCIVRFDEIGGQWDLIMFSSERSQGLVTRRFAVCASAPHLLMGRGHAVPNARLPTMRLAKVT